MGEATEQLGYVLKRAQHAFRLRMDAGLAPLGLTAAQYAALTGLEEQPGLSNAELARRSFVTPQSMIRIVTSLEQRGLLERQPAEHNARVLQAQLTGTGREVLADGHRIVARIEVTMVGTLSPRQVAQTRRSLATLAGNLEGATEPDSPS